MNYHTDERADIPKDKNEMEGFRWRKKGMNLWNYEFDGAPDSYYIRECEIESVKVTRWGRP